ncbi:MAG: WD40 repeat domain-containing protein, partial [Verrucomicrobiaceae bacterium]|nr:WD40 repeat domain-containing protein [Verrucomicrobiaceae bacterium]
GDNRVRIVNDEGTEVRNIADLPDYMQSAVSTPNGATLVAGGEDSLLRVWDAAGKELAAFGAK